MITQTAWIQTRHRVTHHLIWIPAVWLPPTGPTKFEENRMIQSNFHISNTDISKFSVYRSFSQVPTFFLHNLYEKTANISKLYISKFSVYRSFFTSPNVHLHPNSPFIYRIPLTCTNFSRKYCEGFSHLSFADRKNKGPT
mgnify:CR=1 FL=1